MAAKVLQLVPLAQEHRVALPTAEAARHLNRATKRCVCGHAKRTARSSRFG
jgi:hypothetical protein